MKCAWYASLFASKEKRWSASCSGVLLRASITDPGGRRLGRLAPESKMGTVSSWRALNAFSVM